MKASLKAGDHLPITQQLDSLHEPLTIHRECLPLHVKGKALVFNFHDPVSPFVTPFSSFTFLLVLPQLLFLLLFFFLFLTACIFSAYLPYSSFSLCLSSALPLSFFFSLSVSYTVSYKAPCKECTDCNIVMFIFPLLFLPCIF